MLTYGSTIKVYEKDAAGQYQLLQTIVAPANMSAFCASHNGDIFVVGSITEDSFYDPTVVSVGRAWIYDRSVSQEDTWDLRDEVIQPLITDDNEFFGTSALFLRGLQAFLVSASSWRNGGANNVGKAYMYQSIVKTLD